MSSKEILTMVMPITVVLRRLFLITLLFLPQRYWLGRGWQFGGALRGRAARRLVRAFIVLAAIAMVSVLWDRIFRKFLPASVGFWVAPAVQLWIFTSTFAFFCVKAIQAADWLWSKLVRTFSASARHESPDPARRSFLRQAASIVGGAPFVAAIYGYVYERLRFEVVRVDVPVFNLPRALDGLRLVQLSDIHVGDFMPVHEVRRAVEMANGLAPDVVFITGDFVTSVGDPLEECIAELSRLKAPLGIWGCNGNHEIYAGAEDMAESLFRRDGMRLLRQSAAQLQWKGESINLIGIDYQRDVPITGSALPSINGAETLVRSDMPNILLSHNPNTFPAAARMGIELSLAGHTHGGQVNVEVLNKSWSPAHLMTNFVAGLYRLSMASPANSTRGGDGGLSYLYVNRGLGTLGVPARLGARPEITVLTLRSDIQQSRLQNSRREPAA
jgi:uncharacterized protein